MTNFNHLLPTPRARKTLAGLVFLLVASLLIGALTIPFLFESSTMFYKFGVDKFMLRTGKMIGLAAAFLLLVQLPLAGRLKFLDRIFSLPALYRVHRLNAFVICPLVLLHAVCVMVPDDLYMIPLEARYWPEWLGALLLVLILGQVVVSLSRQPLGLSYHRWIGMHRAVGAAMSVVLVVHVLYVSETFSRSGLPRTVVWMLIGTWAILWGWVRFSRCRVRRHPYSISKVTAVGENLAYIIDLACPDSIRFAYAPGQFVFLSFDAAKLTSEAHPFTLSSAPTHDGMVQVTIRTSGDWTSRLGLLEEGDKAFLQGPFGRFTHLQTAADREVVMIAGGIGITPMLSMLRCLNDTNDPRPVTLIWSNRTAAHAFAHLELQNFQQQLNQFRWVPVFTRDTSALGHHGRLNRDLLQHLLTDMNKDALVFICGPPVMIREVRTTLRQLGFAREAIRSELFGF